MNSRVGFGAGAIGAALASMCCMSSGASAQDDAVAWESGESGGEDEGAAAGDSSSASEDESAGSSSSDSEGEGDGGSAGEDEGEAGGDEGEGEAGGHDWLDDLTLRAHVDLYVAAHWGLARAFEANQGPALAHRAYDHQGGATLSFVGLDASYEPNPIGATLRLRFGSSAPRLILNTTGLPDVLQFLYEAYVSWRPIDEVQIDAGEFVTPFGAEVAENWLNQNYTRGALYNLVQPFYHVGLRGVINPVDWLTITLLAVNGWNNFDDSNDGKSGGVQFAFHFDALNFSVGYMVGPESANDPSDPDDENGQMTHFVDAVMTLDLGDFDLVANGDFYAADVGAPASPVFGAGLDYLWGVMLGARYQILPEFAMAARGEYIGNPDEDQAMRRDLITVTGTFEVTVIEHLVLRLDLRGDIGTSPRFVDTTGVGHEGVFSTILGIVVHSD